MNTTSPAPLRFPSIFARTFLRILWDKAIDTPSSVADIFVQFSPHVNSVNVRGYAGGWRRAADADFELAPNFDFADEGGVNEEMQAALQALENFIAAAPGIAKARAEHEAAEAARERNEFGAAVGRYREAKEANVGEAELRRLGIAVDTLMAGMKFADRDGIWWDARHGTWGLGTLEEEDVQHLEAGGVVSGPHALPAS